jgi:DNA-binding NtrC family response regulator
MDRQEETHEKDRAETRQQSIRILVVEDETLFAKAICKRFRKARYTCGIAESLAKADQLIKEQEPHLILLDMRLPDGSGLDFLAQLRESENIDIPVVVLTAYGELEDAVAAMKLKALDYLKKPIDLDELLLTVEKVLSKLERRLDYSKQRESHTIENVHLIGESPAINQVRQQIERIAQLSSMSELSPPTVLILGETGCGKDVSARLLHRQSIRCNRPFVHVDCAALPKDLIEAELFGHEKGAFTSATSVRTGLIEAAEDGTLFLDEIAELPLELQSKLLAVLERRTVRRVGSSRERPVPAWFIASTNRPVEEMVKQGQFRADLYYRLKVLTLTLPPLRERDQDVILLARHFATQTARRFGLPESELSAQVEDALCAYSWPGNVRELAHLIERGVLLSGGEALSPTSLMIEGAPTVEPPAENPLSEMTLDEAETALIRDALHKTDGNVSKAARLLGITRMALRYRMQKYNISSSNP